MIQLPFTRSEFNRIFGEINFNDYSTTSQFSLIDTDKYEIKEKPEWRKKMLEQEIQTIESKLSHYETQVKHLLSIESELKSQNKELKKQLKELDIPEQ